MRRDPRGPANATARTRPLPASGRLWTCFFCFPLLLNIFRSEVGLRRARSGSREVYRDAAVDDPARAVVDRRAVSMVEGGVIFRWAKAQSLGASGNKSAMARNDRVGRIGFSRSFPIC